MAAEDQKKLTKEELVKSVSDAIAKGGEASVMAIVEKLNESLVARFGPAAGVPEYKEAGTQFAEAMRNDPRLALMAKQKGAVPGTDPIAVSMPRYGLKAGEYSAPFTKTNVTQSMFPSQRTYLPFFQEPRRQVFLRDLVPVAGLSTPSLEYARITGCTASTGGVAEAGTKPESAITTSLVVSSVVTMATFIPVSRQAVRDVSGLAAYLNSVLAYFLQVEEDDQILNGAGGSEMTGILNTAGILTRALGTDSKLDAFRKAITDLQIGFSACLNAGFQPTGVVMHPSDWEDLELLKDANERYLLIPEGSSISDGGPQPPRVWRIPVVVTPAISVGTALMGAWDMGATLWTYEDVTLRISDSHASFFIQNLLAVLAELRELLAVYYPSAFVKITGI